MAGPQAPARPASARLRFLILAACAAFAAAQASHASPWIPGERAIVSQAIGELGGEIVQETDLHAELGWPRRQLALVADAFVRAAPERTEAVGAVLVEHALPVRGPWAATASLGPVFVGGSICAGAGADVRAAVGRSIGRRTGRLVARTGFAAVEIGLRNTPGCRVLKTELAIGYQSDEKWLLLAKAFVDQPRHGTDTHKVQISAVRFGVRRGVELGLRARVDRGDPEPAFVVSIWRGRG